MAAVDDLLVQQCLKWYCFEDAVTLAELKYCQDPNDANATLLAGCFHRAGEYRKALHLLEGRSSMCAEARIIMADCALRLGRWREVEQIIGAHKHDLDTLIPMYEKFTIPMLKLLADSYRRRNKMDKAVEAYHRCLTFAPYLLSVFQCLCDLGDAMADKYCELLSASNVRKVLATGAPVKVDFKEIAPSTITLPKTLSPVPAVPDENDAKCQRSGRQAKKAGEPIKALAPRVLAEPRQVDVKTSQAHRRSKVCLLPRKNRRPVVKSEKRPSVTSTDNSTGQTQIDCPMHNLKKQKAEFGSKDSVKENSKASSSTSSRPPAAPPRGPVTRLQQRQQSSTVTTSQQAANNAGCRHFICLGNSLAKCCMNDARPVEDLVGALSWLFSMYMNQKRNDFHTVLSIFGLLPKALKKMHFVLAQKAIAQTELGRFTPAITTFKSIRLMYPMHLESMAIYSTALWHVRAESDLINLAQVLSNVDLKHPSVWCAVGNHFSLQREHDQAIRMFKRAIQLDPNFRYAFALLGNEYLVSDNHELAVSCFRMLLYHNIRDYRAWYGLGSICFCREKYELASAYFERALSVNPSSPVLMCHVAVTQHVRGFTADALATLTRAVTLDPSNSLCRFHRAGVLYSMRNFSEALKELQAIEEIVPNESLVFHMLSKVYGRLKNEQLFLTHVSWAMKLDAKGAHNSLKDTIDRFYSCEDEDTNTDNSIAATSNNTTNAVLSMSRMFRSTPLSTIVIPPTESSTNPNAPSVEFYEHLTASSDAEEMTD